MNKGEWNQWVAEPLTKAIRQSLDRINQAADVRWMAVMPDIHLAKDACVGLVMATDSLIYPQAIGGDIGCGYLTIAVNASATDFEQETRAAKLIHGLYKTVPLNRHRRESAVSCLPKSLSQDRLSGERLQKATRRDGRVQLGTLGRGNHFVEFQADENDRLWLVIHSGSRVMGQLITQHHLRNATVDTGSRLSFLDTLTDQGGAYLNDHAWARRYAAANRISMLRAIEDLLLAEFDITLDETTMLHRDHNHVVAERHFDRTVYVHRKGAQVAEQGEQSIVPGSMGTQSFLVEGRACEQALRSFSHGAGRRLSRAAARKSISSTSFLRQMNQVWYDQRKVQRLVDESPEAYKDIGTVMRAQRDLVKIIATHRPVLNFKSG